MLTSFIPEGLKRENHFSQWEESLAHSSIGEPSIPEYETEKVLIVAQLTLAFLHFGESLHFAFVSVYL